METPRNSTIDTAADQVRTATDRAANTATDAITSAKTSIHDTVNTAADRANTATQWASEKVDAVKRAPADAVEAGADYIKAHPYTAVAVALAVGYCAGRLGRHI